MNRTESKRMDDLPELPFELVLSYLSLEDRLKARAVSRRWCKKIDSLRVKNLCYSQLEDNLFWRKNQWFDGVFALNFISSTRFDLLVNTFAPTILSNVKHLCIYYLRLNQANRRAFAPAVNSFRQLEELVIDSLCNDGFHLGIDLELPMLTSIRLEGVESFEYVNLEAPRLLNVKLEANTADLKVDIVHGESVERLVAECLSTVYVKRLKNLKYLNVIRASIIDCTSLFGLKHLKELHLHDTDCDVSLLFKQKERCRRWNLEIYLFGLLLSSPEDEAIDSLLGGFEEDAFVQLAENLWRLADKIPFCSELKYTAIECSPPGAEIEVAKRFTDLSMITVDKPVQDTQRFLNLLKSVDNVVCLEFKSDQPQDLFDRLSEHCAVRKLTIRSAPSDARFLFRLQDLDELLMYCEVELELIRIFDELQYLSSFHFKYHKKAITIGRSNNSIWIHRQSRTVADVNAAIQLIEMSTRKGKKKPSSKKLSSR